MSLAQSMFAEFEEQVPVTRKFLERLPVDKLTWKPHEKSMSAGQLAFHIATVPGSVVQFVKQNPAQVPEFKGFPQPSNLQEILNAFQESVSTVKSTLLQFNDDAMDETWHLAQGDTTLLTQPRAQFLRDIMLNHWYQHRGQFSVYLRLLNVAVPSSWGPSADEQPTFFHKSQSA
jgi:uncharacterized damage-inducible protein DinB